jgi:hypothetical protein
VTRAAVATLLVLITMTACATSRSSEQYRRDTHMILYARSSNLEACYAKALENDARAQGRVTVRFVVEARTGNIVEPTIDTERTTAPQQLMFCVLEAVEGLQLDPPDANEAHATFVYEFRRPPAAS